ncbi:MAG: type I methionyl aminopeptidase [Patescibacteria group bacterium]
MSKIKTPEEIEILREGGRRLAAVVRKIEDAVAPGVHPRELDVLAHRLITEGGDVPAFLNYKPAGAKHPYPATLCVSVNDEAVHGVPEEHTEVIKEGDIVSLDTGLTHKGLITDMCVTISVGALDERGTRLIAEAEKARDAGIAAARGGAHLGDIGEAIESSLKGTEFSVVPDLGGHGVGHSVHEAPHIFHFGRKGTGAELIPGMVITIEPTVSEGGTEIVLADDGYTYRTKDGSRTAQFEHTILITSGAPEILTEGV